MKARLTILLSFLWMFANAQTTPCVHPVSDLPFAHFDRNKVIFQGDSPSFEHFYAKLDTLFFLGKGHVNIIHIGGSHVQSGVFSQEVSDNLLSLCEGTTAGKGLVFPFSAGNTNNPAGFTTLYTGNWSYCRNAVAFDRTLGLTGAAITTSDSSASITIITPERHLSDASLIFDFNKVKVIGYSDYGDKVPMVRCGGATISGTFDDAQSAYTFDLPCYTDSANIVFSPGEGEFTLQGIYLDNGMNGISFHAIGINGARVMSYIECADLKRDLELVKPDLVIFGIGINDSHSSEFSKQAFMNDYDQLISTILSVNPNCALLFITNNDSYIMTRRNRYEINFNEGIAEQAFLEMGRKYHAGVWDQYDIMGGAGSMKRWEEYGLAKKDKVHFTGQGYVLIGDL